MAILADSVARWFGRVELVARGADEDRREAEKWLEKGNPLQARLHALAVLAKVPGSPIGLALLVDACEQATLDDEAVEALRQLCASAPWRGELWVRLGQALLRARAASSEIAAALQRALDPAMDASARRQALLELADLDLAQGDPSRARRWLEAMRLQGTQPDVALRNLEVGLALGERSLIEASLSALGEPEILEARATLACGRARALLGDPTALDLLLRAFILEAQGVEQALSSFVASCRDVVHVSRVREVLRAAGKDQEPVFALSFALAEGRSDDAQQALLKIASAGDRAAARSLYDIALERRDARSLATALAVLGSSAPREGTTLARASDAVATSRHEEALEILDALVIAEPAALAWAQALRVEVYKRWVSAGDVGWSRLLVALRRAAAAWDRLDLVARCEALSIERQRPLRVAVVGEFNAGKSTFINALLGADVAPTGVLPTTATLHWLAWAPDPFARILLPSGPDRIVTHEALKGALREIQEQGQGLPRQVDICAPLERLKRIELLDTPGFNAPDPEHLKAARRALEEAHVVLWVFDAAQPVKDSERGVLHVLLELGVPLQALVNKSDRLAPDQLHRVLEHVNAGLEEIGLRSLEPATALSARLALAGRLGDGEALARSGWSSVEQLLSEGIVNRSEELRAIAVTRKTKLVAQQLLQIGESWRAQQNRAVPRVEAPPQVLELRLIEQPACEALVSELTPITDRLEEDLRPVKLGSIPGDDPQARAYAEARVVARLRDPIAQAIARVAALEPEPLRQPVEQVLRGAAAIDPYGGLSWRVIRACAAAAAECLSRDEKGSAEADDDAVRVARVAALVEALQGRCDCV